MPHATNPATPQAKRARIDPAQEALACEVAGSVYAGKTTQAAAIEMLVSAGVNSSSALDFIRAYKYLMEGRVFQRAMSARGMELFMGAIEETHGQTGLRSAVKALDAHIAYWEGHYQTRAIAMRRVADQFRSVLIQPEMTLKQVERALDEQVQRSLADSSRARAERLRAAEPKPKKIQVATTAYLRNPDVIAAVLLRAAGTCEACQTPAPFIRRSDGYPYLEVHHRMRLADGGDDTVENALALCPNCHRKSHFG